MGNEQSYGVLELEWELQQLSQRWTTPRTRECLYCFVYRLLEFGCHGLTYVRRYRALRAPRATALERRLGSRGGFCDCEIFLNAVAPHPSVMVPPPPPVRDPDGFVFEEDWRWPDPFPDCLGVRAGSTAMCELWTWLRRR